MKRFIMIAAGLVLATAVGCGIIFAVVFTATQGVVDAGDAFMVALQEQRIDDAYAMFAPELQAEISFADFDVTFGSSTYTSWSFNSREIENNLGQVSGTLLSDGVDYTMMLGFINNETGWQLIRYEFVPTE